MTDRTETTTTPPRLPLRRWIRGTRADIVASLRQPTPEEYGEGGAQFHADLADAIESGEPWSDVFARFGEQWPDTYSWLRSWVDEIEN